MARLPENENKGVKRICLRFNTLYFNRIKKIIQINNFY